MDGWIDINLFEDRWMLTWTGKQYKDCWMDRQMDDWMDIQIY